MTRPCLKDNCWCKDLALPKIDSLWQENSKSLYPKIFRICISRAHDEMYAKDDNEAEFQPKPICFIVNNTIDMTYIHCLTSFLNNHLLLNADEV